MQAHHGIGAGENVERPDALASARQAPESSNVGQVERQPGFNGDISRSRQPSPAPRTLGRTRKSPASLLAAFQCQWMPASYLRPPLASHNGGYSDNERRSFGRIPSPPPPVRMEHQFALPRKVTG